MTDASAAPSIGRRIAAYRRYFEVGTAADLATKTANPKITESVIQNIESGRKADLAVSQLLDIAKAIGISPLFLLVPVGRPHDKIDLVNVGESIAAMTSHEFDSWFTVSEQDPPGENPKQASLRLILRYTRRLVDAVAEWEQAKINPDLDAEPFEYEAQAEDGTTYMDSYDPSEFAHMRLGAAEQEITKLSRYLAHYNVDLSWVPKLDVPSDG